MTDRPNQLRRVAAAAGASLLLALGCAGAATAAAPGEIPKPPGANPDDRGWEKVSPADKNGSDVYYGAGRVQTTAAGDRATFIADRAFGGGAGAPVVNDYVAQRTSAGWSTRNVTGSGETDPLASNIDTRFGYRLFSADLTHGVLMSNDSQEILRRLHRRDLVEGGDIVLTPPPVAPLDPFEHFFASPLAAAGSEDLEHVVFESGEQYTADAPAPTTWKTQKVYEWTDGQTRLVGLIPPAGETRCGEGEPSACVAAAETVLGRGAYPGNMNNEAVMGGTVSRDGSRIFFTKVHMRVGDNSFGYSGDLYVRENGVRTIQVSASQRTDCAGDPTCGGDGEPDPAPDPEEPGEVMFGTATRDGDFVFFSSCRRLTDDATSLCNAGQMGERWEAYRYAVDTGELTNLTAGSPATVANAGIIGASDDGTRLYFEQNANNPLATIYLWQNGQIAKIGSGASYEYVKNSTAFLDELVSYVTADGRYLLWLTDDPVGDFDGTGPTQVFIYDADNDTRRCLSCPADGRAPTGLALPYAAAGGGSLTFRQGRLRSIDAAGSRVFFETSTALVAQDTNGLRDVYQYDVATGEHALISSGKGSAPASFGNASPDGSSVFFVTAQRLVAADGDRSRDLYVARVGGGFPEPAAVDSTGCEGDGCQGPVSGGPDRKAPSSRDLQGAGDRAAARGTSLAIGSLSSSARQRAARKGRLTVAVRTSEPGRVTVAARAKLRGRSVVVGRASKQARGAGRVRLVLRLSPPARRRLADGGRLRLRVTAAVPGARAARTLVLSAGRAG